ARFALAYRRWRQYRERLGAHIESEEAWLDRMDSATLQWRVKVYKAEHRRLLLLADRIAARLAHPPRRAKADYRIDMLERQKSLKGVLEHHHAREEQDLYVALDTQATTHRQRTNTIHG